MTTDRACEPQPIECRLIEPHSTRILTTAAQAGPLLPRESMPAHSRAAEALTEAVQWRFGLRSIQLALLPGTKETGPCAVHEILGSREVLPQSFSFKALDEIASNEFIQEERTIVLRIMNGEASELGRFARLGWIEQLLAKVGSHAGRGSWQVNRQLNQGIDFCLISLADANGCRIWFKAVGEPNTCEYALTFELTRRFPAYLPKTLVTIPEWNGWVTEHVQGAPLNESNEIHHCEEALTALALMQKETSSDMASLLALGAKDWTCARISSLMGPFFEEAGYAMQAHTSAKCRPLNASELDQLRINMDLALDEFVSGGVPETLVHGDIGHGNIIASFDGPVFLDWAETFVGHPFLSAEHLLADLARSNSLFHERLAALRAHYASHWKALVPPARLERVTSLAPAIAALAYAVIAWDANRRRPTPARVWPLLRSMLRRVKRELEQISEVMA